MESSVLLSLSASCLYYKTIFDVLSNVHYFCLILKFIFEIIFHNHARGMEQRTIVSL